MQIKLTLKHLKPHVCSRAVMLQRRMLLPQQEVNQHGDGEKGASDGRVAAQEEEEVAEKTEEDDPDHVKLKK